MTLRRSLPSFAALLAACLGGISCKHYPDEHDRQGSQIHFDLGVQAQIANDAQGAYREFKQASDLDPMNAEAHNALGILLHLAFNRPEQAIAQYREALENKPTFSEAKVNLANVYLSQDKYEDAIVLYEQALNDMLYPTPFIAQNNLGWAYFKKGDAAQGLSNIKAAVTTNPKFCQGYRNLALIYDAQNSPRLACDQWHKYAETCPDQPEPLYRGAMCLLRQGDAAGAKKSFTECVNKAKDELKEDCRVQLEQLSGRTAQP